MSLPTRVQDRSPAEIAAALTAWHLGLSYAERPEIEEFVDRIGGVRNAVLAIELLQQLEDAA